MKELKNHFYFLFILEMIINSGILLFIQSGSSFDSLENDMYERFFNLSPEFGLNLISYGFHLFTDILFIFIAVEVSFLFGKLLDFILIKCFCKKVRVWEGQLNLIDWIENT